MYDSPINNLGRARPFSPAEICVRHPGGCGVELFRTRADAARTRLTKSPDFRRSFAAGRFEIRRLRSEEENNAPPCRPKAVSHLPAVKQQNRAWIYDAVVCARGTSKIFPQLPRSAMIYDLKLNFWYRYVIFDIYPDKIL